MKFDKFKIYCIEIFLIAILSFALFVLNEKTKTMLAVCLLILTVLISFLIRKRKVEDANYKKVAFILAFLGIIYLIVFFSSGLFFGYTKTKYSLNFNTIVNYIVPTLTIIISSEVIRNILVVQNTKFPKTITCIIMVLVELILYVDIYNVKTYQEIIDVFAFIFIAAISSNLLFNYTSKKYGVLGNIIYRSITILYVYLIPYTSNILIFFRAVFRIIYPYIIYHILEYTFSSNKETVAYEDKTKEVVVKVTILTLMILLVMLVSCQFKYGILVIASGSMTGTLNYGDAIIFERFDEDDEIENNQIVVFNENNLRIVHRVISKKNVNGEMRYITKGDANQKNDDGYITDEDILGYYKFKISYLGYPSLWIRDILTNKR